MQHENRVDQLKRKEAPRLFGFGYSYSILPLATQCSALQHRCLDIISTRTSSYRCDTCDLPQKTPCCLEPGTTSPIRRICHHGVRRSTHALVSTTFFPPALVFDLAITLTFALARVVTPAITRLGKTARPTSAFAQPTSHAYTRGTSLPPHERARPTTVQRVLGKTTMTRFVNIDTMTRRASPRCPRLRLPTHCTRTHIPRRPFTSSSSQSRWEHPPGSHPTSRYTRPGSTV
jgi:hypothetical protein